MIESPMGVVQIQLVAGDDKLLAELCKYARNRQQASTNLMSDHKSCGNSNVPHSLRYSPSVGK